MYTFKIIFLMDWHYLMQDIFWITRRIRKSGTLMVLISIISETEKTVNYHFNQQSFNYLKFSTNYNEDIIPNYIDFG